MTATPIVLLHGVGLDHTMWQPAIEAFEAAGRTVHALDLPGHGSESPLRIPPNLTAYADDIMRRLPSVPVHLVGFSLGALIAQRIALSAPQSLVSLTCVSGVCRRTTDEKAAVLERLQLAETNLPATVERSLQRWYPSGTRVDAETIEATQRILEANDITSFVNSYRIFATADAELAPLLGNITVPVLAITGELDPGSTPDMTHRLAGAVSHGQAHIIQGARHMLPVETPAEFVQQTLTFINDVEGTPHD